MYNELKKLGYKFNNPIQFDCYTFKDNDNCVIPIIIKYIEQLNSENLRLQYISSLGVKGFSDATKYLITKYKQYLSPDYNQQSLNVVSQTLARIQDLRYLDEYFKFLNKNVTIDACYLVQMLGANKVKEALPYLIELLDCVAIIPQKWIGTVLEDQKYYVSQCAIEALGKYKNLDLNKYILKFLNPEQLDWISFSESKERNYLLKTTYKEYIKVAKSALHL